MVIGGDRLRLGGYQSSGWYLYGGLSRGFGVGWSYLYRYSMGVRSGEVIVVG